MRNLLLFSLLLISIALKAQLKLPSDYFSSPLKAGLHVIGGFGETRPDHFHSGIDFSTMGREGVPVYAVADGFVSRIKVQASGFGNALYIDHPNGFTSVYGHLQKYRNDVSLYLKKQQYKLRSFEVDLFPPGQSDTIWIQKGSIIGYSGNTGQSYGAHLHFEIRDTKTERTINPAILGLPIIDYNVPAITLFKMYPENKMSTIDSIYREGTFQVRKVSPGNYRLKNLDTLNLYGKFAFGIEAYDFGYDPANRNGFYKVSLKVDSVLLFSQAADSFAFSETRCVNACIDYPAYSEEGKRIMLSKRKPNNPMSFFKPGYTNGVADFTDGKFHELTYTVYDNFNHKAVLIVPIVSRRYISPLTEPTSVSNASKAMDPLKFNQFSNEEVKVEIPARSLFDSIHFSYTKYPGTKNDFSDRHEICDPIVPLMSRIILSIKAVKLPAILQDKALLVKIGNNGRRQSAGGGYENGYVTARVLSFGEYCIGVDTIPPVIKPSALNKPRKRHSLRELQFRVTDNLSGIEKYQATVNGKWALLEYDAKRNLLSYHFDETAIPGVNRFRLRVEDPKGNSSVYNTTFVKR